MRLLKLVSLLTVLFASGSSLAQGWIKYADEAQRFIVNFPGEPVVRDISYLSEFDATYPARVYAVDNSPSRFAVTVVDYTEAESVHQARCERLGYECDGFEAGGDVRGSIAYAAWNIRQSTDGEITYDAYAAVDGIPGHQLQITGADEARTYIGIFLHARRLYILEGTVPEDWPPPGHFQQSLGILDGEGKRIRYRYDAEDNRVRIETSYEWIGVEDPETGEPQIK